MTAAANRGRYAEGKVQEWLRAYKGDRLTFTYNRNLDAHSAKGALSNPQPGDFQWFLKTEAIVTVAELAPGSQRIHEHEVPYTRNGLIEVKEVEHEYRLSHSRFAPDQMGRMRIRQLAGSEPLVLVCFRPPGGRTVWRSETLEYFQDREGASWDMRDIDAYTHCGDILEGYLK